MTELHSSEVVRARLDLVLRRHRLQRLGASSPRCGPCKASSRRPCARVVRGPGGAQLGASRPAGHRRRTDRRGGPRARPGRPRGPHPRFVASAGRPIDARPRPGAARARQRRAARRHRDPLGHAGAPRASMRDSRRSSGAMRTASPTTRRAATPSRGTIVTWTDRDLDVDALNEASATLTGLRDFAVFCRPREGATTVRDLRQFSWERVTHGARCGPRGRDGEGRCVLPLDGAQPRGGRHRGGNGQEGPRAGSRTLAAGTERSDAVAVAPARGLTLEEVLYPPDENSRRGLSSPVAQGADVLRLHSAVIDVACS